MASEMNRMINYIKYGLSLKTTTADGREYFLVGINFDNKWQIVEPSEETGVSCVAGNDGESQFYYFTPIENGVNVIFDCIDETIHYNEDVEKKLNLFKVKVAELQELFATKDYDYLSHLQFTYELPKKGKRGRPKKEEPIEEPVETVEEHPIEVKEGPVEVNEPIVEDKPVETGNNKEEASEIDKKIAALLGK